MTLPLEVAPPSTRPDAAITITVYGEPIPQGSKVAFASRNPGKALGVASMKDANEKALKPWRRQVHKATEEVMRTVASARRPLLDGPLAVRMVFTFTRPKTVTRLHPCVRPDGDKLARACADSMTTARLWPDDGRVVDWTIRKVYVACDPEALPRPGVVITVRPVA